MYNPGTLNVSNIISAVYSLFSGGLRGGSNRLLKADVALVIVVKGDPKGAITLVNTTHMELLQNKGNFS